MASPGQRKGACGHIMVSFDTHSHCARCRDKGLGEDPCVSKLPCEYCDLLTPEQVIQLATPTYKLRKEKAKSKETLTDPASVTVVAQVDSQDMEPSVSTHESSSDLSLPQPSFRKDLQDLDEKWSVRMARLEALLTLSSRPIAQDTLRKWENAAKETSYICNQSAGFNRCITKIQDSVQDQLKILQNELEKGKSSPKAQAALDEIHYLNHSTKMLVLLSGSPSNIYQTLPLYRWPTSAWSVEILIWIT